MGFVHDIKYHTAIGLELGRKVLPPGPKIGSGADNGIIVAHEAGLSRSQTSMRK
jgi:hypothetical protein